MFTQFSEISSRFIHSDKAKGCKTLIFSPQYIEHKISIFNETINLMKEYKLINIQDSLQQAQQHGGLCSLNYAGNGHNCKCIRENCNYDKLHLPYMVS